MVCCIQIASDLHLEVKDEYASFDIPAAAPYLILAGDIGRLVDYKDYLGFLERLVPEFELIFLVLGNHEFYGLSHSIGLQTARSLLGEKSLLSKVILLDQAAYHLPDINVAVLGCTLWTAIPDDKIETVMSRVKDYREISDWCTATHNRCHRRDLAWLRYEVESMQDRFPDRKLVVVSHHAPCFHQTSKPQHADNPWNCAFATDLIHPDSWKGVEVWIFGHTHYSTDFNKDGIRVIANQRGYRSAQPAGLNDNCYEARKIIEV